MSEISTAIKVSVIMLTYNQEHFIAQAIEGVLMQNLNFEVELIIADDASTDNTQQIVMGLCANHINGSWIKYTKHEINKGVLSNSLWAFQKAQGKYIAICEGDDYWTDPLKLQLQVEFLDANPENSMCFHSVQLVNQIEGTSVPEVAAANRNYNTDELVLSKMMHTVSFVFRKKLLNTTKLISKAIFGVDGFLVLLMAEHGKIYGFSRNMAVYRTHETGISSLDAKRLGILHQKRFIKQYIFFKKSFKNVSKEAINIKIVDYCMVVANYYYKKRNPQAMLYILLAFYHRPTLILKGLKKIKL